MNTITGQKSRPKAVGWSVALLCAALAIGVLRVIEQPTLAGIGLTMTATFVLLGLAGLLVGMIWQGSRWARVAYLIWFSFGLVE